jgi:hypothetical protein
MALTASCGEAAGKKKFNDDSVILGKRGKPL